jgi:dTDP-4-amino-4,6-dideoxyglucose
MKHDVDDLAIFGGAPLFASPRPIGQLDTPDIEDYLTLLKEIFAARRLTNDGPMVDRLERELAAFHGVKHCIAVANAGLGLIMLMQMLANGRRGNVIMPSFSYRGLPHFAQWAGLMPQFCDVAEATHGLDPLAVSQAIDGDTVAILGVCNCNDPGDIDGLVQVAADRGIPIIFDSVYALGGTYRGRRLGCFGLAEVFSLHATKMLNGFEGGYVTTDDDALASKLRWARNFSLPGLAPSDIADDDRLLGMNAKLNQLHAAMALLSLHRYDDIVRGNKARYDAYRRACAGIPGLRLVPFADADSEQRNFGLVLLETGEDWPLSRDASVALLKAEGAAISAYYSPPLHRSEHCPAGIAVPDLPVSDSLARRFLQLPSGDFVSEDDIGAVGALLRFVGARGTAIAARLAAGKAA